ncbi:MAG: hypothetical protein COC22_00270 [Flavobacteriaceae bacterium]|nr:MAG: hypothetical protein COC22_00270 [Flavobacteriaceae bacterium]
MKYLISIMLVLMPTALSAGTLSTAVDPGQLEVTASKFHNTLSFALKAAKKRVPEGAQVLGYECQRISDTYECVMLFTRAENGRLGAGWFYSGGNWINGELLLGNAPKGVEFEFFDPRIGIVQQATKR